MTALAGAAFAAALAGSVRTWRAWPVLSGAHIRRAGGGLGSAYSLSKIICNALGTIGPARGGAGRNLRGQLREWERSEKTEVLYHVSNLVFSSSNPLAKLWCFCD